MSTIPVTYPFDPTGTAITNLVVREEQILTPVNVRDFQFIIPSYAPFFRAGLIVKHVNSNRTLVEGLDYVLGYEFVKASRAVAKPIYGGIVFYDRSLAGVVQVTYQTVGGEWTLSASAIADILVRRTVNPRVTTWEEVANQPQRFPPIEHEWDVDDMVGMSDVVESLNRMAVAIRAGADETALAHFNNYENPHQTTKAQVGLGSVENLPRADVPTAVAGLSNNFYMTPLTAKALAQSVANSALLAHSQDHSNPHQTNKSQVGLGLVQNFGVASDTQAEGGTSQDTYMTPFLTKLSIQALLGNTVNAHLIDYDNPHHVNKSQIGLSLVQNFGIAEDQEARDGIVQNKYMTPYLTKLSVQALVTTALNTHVADLLNPHQVTKAQVGLSNVPNFAMATNQAAEEGISQTAFMSPFHVKLAIQQLAAGNIDVHISDLNNPHQVTAAQLGVLTAVEVTTLLAEYALKSDPAGNSLKLEGKSLAEILALSDGSDADTLEGKSLSDIMQDAAALTVANSDKLGGMNLLQIEASITAEMADNYVRTSMFTATVDIGASWTLLASAPYGFDKRFIVSGAEPMGAYNGSTYLVQLSMLGDQALSGVDGQYLSVTAMAKGLTADDCEFGFVHNTDLQRIECWLKSPTPRNDVFLNDLNTAIGSIHTAYAEVIVEPVGINYVTITVQEGGGITEADLNATITEFATELMALPLVWAGNITTAVFGNMTGYVSSTFTGGPDSGTITTTTPLDGGGTIHMVGWGAGAEPGSTIVGIYVEGTYPDGLIHSVKLNDKVFDTQGDYVATPFNGHFVYSYSFVVSNVLDLPGAGTVTVEIR